jgi:hypothetical protein
MWEEWEATKTTLVNKGIEQMLSVCSRIHKIHNKAGQLFDYLYLPSTKWFGFFFRF